MSDYGVKVARHVKRVTTMRKGRLVAQNHRGYTAYVFLRGERDPYLTGTHHQQAKAARAEGERYARYLLRERAAKEET